MKSLDKMSNPEKGKLLADLLPDQLPDLILYISHQTARFIKSEEQVKATWTAGLITADFWYSLVEGVEKTIARYGNKLTKNNRLFAHQLFDSYNVLFIIYCLVEFTGTKDCKPQLRNAVHLLFGSDNLSLTDNTSVQP